MPRLPLALSSAILALGCASLAADGAADVAARGDPVTVLGASGEVARKLHPIWLPDRETIVFSGEIGGNWDLFLLPAGDARMRRLTEDPGFDGSPAVWPGPRRIVFERFDPVARTSRMWSIRLDGTDQRPLTDRPGFRPEPSPDGRRIAFDNAIRIGGRGTHQLFVMNADGTALARLTETETYEASPSWSPRGDRIAFFSQRDDSERNFRTARSEIYVMDANGGNERRLTRLNAHSQYPAWSPRSDWIAFESDVVGNIELYLVRADGRSEPIRLTGTPGAERSPSWSVDGRRLAYAYEQEGRVEIRTLALPPRLARTAIAN